MLLVNQRLCAKLWGLDWLATSHRACHAESTDDPCSLVPAKALRIVADGSHVNSSIAMTD